MAAGVGEDSRQLAALAVQEKSGSDTLQTVFPRIAITNHSECDFYIYSLSSFIFSLVQINMLDLVQFIV